MRVYLHWGEGPGWLSSAFLGIGLLLMVLGIVAPAALGGLNRLWTKLGLVLAKVVNPIVLGLIFLVTIVPTGLIIRLMGGDPLNRKFDPEAPSYWIDRDPPGPDPDGMKNQF